MKADSARLAAALFGCDQNWLASGVGSPNWIAEVAKGAPQITHLTLEKTARTNVPSLEEALPVVLDAIASAHDKKLLRAALMVLIEDDSTLYRQRIAELIGAAWQPAKETAHKMTG